MKMGNKGFIAYLLSASSVAILSASFLTNRRSVDDHLVSTTFGSHTARVWPELEVSWKSACATMIGFVGSAFGTVGGVGGGGIFVTMLNVIVGFDTKSAAALSKCMIMGASMSSVWYNMRIPHPMREVPIIDYDLAFLFQPMLMLGITIGVSLSVVFPYWLITILIIILFIGTSSRSFFKATLMWKDETLMKMKEVKRQETLPKTGGDEVVIDYQPLLPREEKTILEILRQNLRWRGLLVLMLVWFSFLLLQVLKNQLAVCSTLYWVIYILQFPVSMGVFIWEAAGLYRGSRNRRNEGNDEYVCEAAVEWTASQLLLCAFCGILGGTVGGLLGSGGGFVLGPLLLELGVIPQVASATATFVMMFSSSLSVVEFAFLDRFPIPYAMYLMSVSIIAGFWGQYLVRKMVMLMKRASVIVFILSSVIFASALVMGIVGVDKSIDMIHRHEYMGFLSFCEK